MLGTQHRKNIESIGLDVKNSDYQGMEQFISSSPWDHQAVMDQVTKVPEEHRQYRSKHDQALEMIIHAKELGLKFGWVGFDSLYGTKRKLVNAVEDMGLYFVGDVHKTTKIWNAKPLLDAPGALEGAGRPAKNYRLSTNNQANYCSMESLARECLENSHQRVWYRKGNKGELWTKACVTTVWSWEAGLDQARERLLIVKRDRDGSFKYTLSNLAAGKDWSYCEPLFKASATGLNTPLNRRKVSLEWHNTRCAYGRGGTIIWLWLQ